MIEPAEASDSPSQAEVALGFAYESTVAIYVRNGIDPSVADSAGSGKHKDRVLTGTQYMLHGTA